MHELTCKKCRQVESLIARKASQGAKPSPREVVQAVREVRSVSEAKALLDMAQASGVRQKS